MLDTVHTFKDGKVRIVATDKDGKEAGEIIGTPDRLWTVLPSSDEIPVKAFFSYQASEYYLLAAYLESKAEF